MNTIYGQDLWNYGVGTLRNSSLGFGDLTRGLSPCDGGRKAVAALRKDFCHFLRFAAVLFLMVVGVSGVRAQITPGFYFIANNAAKADGANYSYDSSNPANSFYLCPAIGCYYDNNIDLPHLTTFKTNQDQNSLWKIEAVSGETDCYYLIHYKTGKYLKSNETPNYIIDGNKNRKVVHLEKKTADDDSYKFYIKNKSDFYQIYPKVYKPGGTTTDASEMSLNVKADNWSMYVPQNGLASGIIGVYDYLDKNNKPNPGSQWALESFTSTMPCATPIVKFSRDVINISYPYSDEGITIYYTIDGTKPTTSSSNQKSTNFDISASGVIKVRAFAAKSGYEDSDEAVLWGSARPFLIQSKENANYYLVPTGDGKNVNTSSLASEAMQWTFGNAGASTSGMPYYFIVNSNGKKINYNTSDNTLTLNEASDAANKFCIIEDGNSGEFFIIPINGASTGNDKNCRAVFKKNGNVTNDKSLAEVIYGNTEDNINRVHWLLRVCNDGADQKNLFSDPLFNVSTDEETYYYHIASVGTPGDYIVPPADAEGYATTSSTNSDYTDNPWLFKVAASDNWLTYYYVINAASGKYMYFNPNNNLTADQTNVISMKDISEKNESNEERFQFVMVRSTTSNACFIVPKGYSYADGFHKNFNDNKYFGLSPNESNPLKATWSRASGYHHTKWTFELTTYANVWADPEISCDLDGKITITNGEEAEGTEFYYTKNNSTTLPATPTATESETNFKYNSSSKPTAEAGFTTIKVRAIASGKAPSNVVTKTIVYNPTITLTAESYTYTGTAQNPISTVKVGETTIASSEYNVKYKKGDDELTEAVDAGTYTILLTDVDDGDYIVYGKNQTFTIGKADINPTVTIDDWTYGGTAATPSVTGNTGSGAVTYMYKVQGAGDDTYSEAVPTNAGSYTVQATIAETDNYNGKTVTTDFTISRADFDPTVSITGWVYGGTANAPSVIENPGNAAVTYMYKVQGAGDDTYSEAVPTNAGNYTVQAIISESDNYSSKTVTTNFTISKVTLTVAANDKTITYGDAPANDGVTYDGFVNGESAATEGVFSGTLEYDYSYTQYGDVGNTYTITPKGLTATNYEITYTPGTLTVEQKEVGLDWSNIPLTYNGATQAPTATATGVVNSDEISVTVTGTQSDAGTGYTATASELTGTKAGNYKLPTNNTTTFEIGAKTLTITAEAKSKTYGDDDPELTYTSEGLVGSDAITGSLSRVEGEIVGTYAINQGDLSAGSNYAISYTGANLTISKKALTITAVSDSKGYDGTPLTNNNYTNTELATGDAITSVTVTGSQTEYGSSENVPSGAVIKNGNGEGVDVTACYEITYENGTLTVAGMVITITADSDTKVYDGTALTKDSYICENTLFSGDVITSVTVTGSQTEAGSSENTPSAAVIENAGTDVTGNYHIIYVNGTLTVTRKDVTITASDASKTYNGSALTETGFTASALEDGDTHTFTIVMTEESTITNVGTKDNEIATVDGVAVATGIPTDVGNYKVTTANGTLTINPKTVTITASDGSKTYNGSELTETGFTASPLEEGDNHTFTVEMTAESTITDVGTQPNVIATVDGVNVTTGEETSVGNYLVTTANGMLTIDAKSIGDGALADGFTLSIGAENAISLKDGENVLEEDNHYTVGDATTSESGRYSIRTVSGKGNYGGFVNIRNAITHFMNDGNGGSDYSATFVAESADPTANPDPAKGHALPNGVTAYIITSIEEKTANAVAIDYIPEGVPVLLLANSDVNGFLVEDATVTDEQKITEALKHANMLKEVTASTANYVSDSEDTNYQTAHFDVKTIYLLYKNEFVYNMDGYLSKGKVYLDPSPSTPAPSRLMIYTGGETGIESLQYSIDLHLETWYSIDGRRLSGKPTRKGLYIRNGQKVVIK